MKNLKDAVSVAFLPHVELRQNFVLLSTSPLGPLAPDVFGNRTGVAGFMLARVDEEKGTRTFVCLLSTRTGSENIYSQRPMIA